MQTSHGPITQQQLEPLGIFDVIGRDRRSHWSQLGKEALTDGIVNQL